MSIQMRLNKGEWMDKKAGGRDVCAFIETGRTMKALHGKNEYPPFYHNDRSQIRLPFPAVRSTLYIHITVIS